MFQYVSIISVSTIPSRILFPRFTFQYVSIISQQCQKEAQFTAIYIPICFYYFPSIPSALIPSGSSFTFQYVSIISRFPFLATLITYIFTFQYVSIISVFPELHFDIQSNLHSNMFLLFQVPVFALIIPYFYLHSNMFLLFRTADLENDSLNKYLHSNMFLLFRTEKQNGTY